MDILRSTATGVARYLAGEMGLNAKDTETIRFGVEYYMGFFVNLGLVIAIAFGLGIIPYVLAALFSSVLLRFVSGGAHCSTFLRCLLLGTVVIVGIGQLASVVGMLVPQALLYVLVVFSVVTGFYSVDKWAPCDTPAKPIVSPLQRAKYKRLSFIFIALWATTISLFLILSGKDNAPFISALIIASIGGFWWQILSITPFGYRLVTTMEMLFNKCFIAFKQ